MKRIYCLTLGIIVITYIPIGTSQAQTANTGAIMGSVLDATGAVVQKAHLDITSEATGATRKVTTGGDGVYRVPLLPPGSYRVEATASGFKVAVRPYVPVRVTETTGLDIRLEVGSPSETVNVEATPELAQTESSALGRVTDERSVNSLPLVTRNFTQIIGLSPGVSVGLTDAAQIGAGAGGATNFTNEDLSVNGARSYDNNFQMDGVTANDQGAYFARTGGVAVPNPDSIAEFKVQTGQYDASYGRNAGANVDVVTKSGSNQFHGNLFEFFRNEDLNANSFFFNQTGISRGILRQNQFGGVVGGPILKDKLLFFGSYQGTRQLNGVASGCGSSLVGPPLTNDRSAAALGALYGGQTGALGGVAVARDGSNINPVALALLNAKLPDGSYVVPTPQNISDGAGEYAFSTPCPFHEDQFMTNIDFLQSAKSRLTGKFFFSNQDYTSPAGSATVPGSPQSSITGFRNLSLAHDYTFSASLLNQVQFGFHTTRTVTLQIPSFTYPQIGSSVYPQAADLALLSIGGTELVGAFQNTTISSDVYTLQDTLTYIRGRHNFRFGGGVTRTVITIGNFAGSQLTFLSMPDLLLGQSSAQNGSPFSNIYQSADYPGNLNRNYFIWNPWIYAQDDFKVNARLTLNLGFRYERIGDFADENGRNSSFDPTLANPNPSASGSQAGYVLPSNFRGTVPAGSIRLNNKLAIDGEGQSTFSPRAGFAWQVLPASSRFVLRGGYGIYYSSMVGGQALAMLGVTNCGGCTGEVGGLAVSPDGTRLLVTNVMNDSVSWIDIASGAIVAEQDLRPGIIDATHHGQPGGSYPRAVTWTSLTSAYVASERDREVIALNFSRRRVRVAGRMSVRGQPVALLANRSGSRLYVALDTVNQVAIFDTAHNKLIESLDVVAPRSIYSNTHMLGGANTNALALTPDESTLLVSNGGENAVAVVRLSHRARGADVHRERERDDDEQLEADESEVIGLVPTGWYPSGLATSKDGAAWFVVNGKSPTGPNVSWCVDRNMVRGVCVSKASQMNGDTWLFAENQHLEQLEKASLLTLPAPPPLELARLTKQVARNNHFDRPEKTAADERLFSFLREHIKHVIYIMKENRTYDQVLGDLEAGNGDRRFTLFPEKITPNHHAIARNFVDLDNTLVSGEGSPQGMTWTYAAQTTDYNERNEPHFYADRGVIADSYGNNRAMNMGNASNQQRHAENLLSPSDPDILPGAHDVNAPDGPGGTAGQGYIWDVALRQGLTVRNWGLAPATFSSSSLVWNMSGLPPLLRDPYKEHQRVFSATNASLMSRSDPYFYTFDPALPDYWRVQEWKREFAEFSAANSAANLMLLWLANDHFGEYNRAMDGVNTPETQMADNDYALGLSLRRSQTALLPRTRLSSRSRMMPGTAPITSMPIARWRLLRESL